MININLDKRCIFTYDSKKKSIIIYRHRDGCLEGPVEGPLGTIEFANKWQINHLIEMLVALSEKIKE